MADHVSVLPAVTVRNAARADFEAVRDLQQILDDGHADNLPSVIRRLDTPRFNRSEYEEWIFNDNCCFLVAECAGEIVGFVDASVMQPDDLDDVDRPWCGVHNLAVKPNWRRRGIASRLMLATEGWVRRRGLGQLRLSVYEFNAGARAMYEQLGYTTYFRQMLKSLDEA